MICLENQKEKRSIFRQQPPYFVNKEKRLTGPGIPDVSTLRPGIYTRSMSVISPAFSRHGFN
jgi:hypothetical protein